ncbi:MAG: nucleotidyltransferase domain-containing protein [Deltaproteobacteria bacterium]|nr:nucleotidyltransferase domain-containing protein [Deltaproteobacteria bacterium]
MSRMSPNFHQVEKVKTSLLRLASDVFGKYPVLFAYLYGSYATGLVHPFSDLDIGIYVEKMARREYLSLEIALSLEIDEKLGDGTESEVRIINELPLVVTGRILTEGILIFSRDEDVRVDFETSVRGAYFDFIQVLHRHQETFIKSIVS